MKNIFFRSIFSLVFIIGLLLVACEENDQPVYGPDNPDPNPTGSSPASLSELNPAEGFLKDIITVRGSGFNTTPEFNQVRFGNKVGTVISATATELSVETPNIAGETVMVSVAAKGSEFWSNEIPFTFKPTLAVLDSETIWPNGIAVDNDGNVYIGARADGKIIKIAPDGTRSDFAEVPVVGAIRFGPQNYLYVCEKDDGKVQRISPDGSIIEDVVEVESPVSLDWDANGTMYIVSGDAGINIMDSGGNLSYLDLEGAPVKNCRVFANHLYINRIWDGTITRFEITAGGLGEEEIYMDGSSDGYSPSSFEFDANGTMYWSHAWDANLYTVTPDGAPGEVLYEGQLTDPAVSPLRYMTFHGKSLYFVFPGWADVGYAMSAYIGVEAAPNYGTGN